MAIVASDLAGVGDLTPDMRESTGKRALAEAIARRLITPRGTLLSDANYGFDLTQYLNDDVSQIDLARIQSGIEAECLKDERVDSAQVSLELNSNSIMVVNIVLTVSEENLNLVLSVTAVTADILAVS